MNYGKARELTARNGRKKVAHNTYLERDEVSDDIDLVYHYTAIVTYHNDGTMTLRTGGWCTATTKDRLNRFTPAAIRSERGDWFLCSVSALSPPCPVRIEFEEEMRIDEHGRPVDFTSYADDSCMAKVGD